MDVIPIKKEVFARLTGKSDKELDNLLFQVVEGEEKPTLKEGVDPSKVLESHVKTKLDALVLNNENQYKRGTKERGTRIEKAITKYFPTETALEPEELVEGFVNSVKASNTGENKTEVTIDDLDKLPAAQSWLDQKLAKVKEKYESEKGELQTQYDNLVNARRSDIVKSQAFEILTEARWNMGEDKATQKLRKEGITRLLLSEKIQVDENGGISLLDANGNPMRDELQNPVAFKDIVMKYGQAFGGFHVVDPSKSSPGAKPSGTQGNGNGLVVESKEQYDKLKTQAMQIADSKKRRARIAELATAYTEHRRNVTE